MPRCTAPDCTRDVYELAPLQGLCSGHYRRKQRGMPLDAPVRRWGVSEKRLSGVRMNPETHEALERESKRTGETPYEVARRVLEAWAAKHK